VEPRKSVSLEQLWAADSMEATLHCLFHYADRKPELERHYIEREVNGVVRPMFMADQLWMLALDPLDTLFDARWAEILDLPPQSD